MGFLSHAAMLGVGYWVGKSYCFRYKVHELQNDPNSSEYVLRVERKEGPFWGGHGWWHHHHCHHRYQETANQPNGSAAPAQQTQQQMKNPEILEVETK